MAKRNEEAAVEAVAVDRLIKMSTIYRYTNRKLELSTGLWSAIDSDLQRIWDVLDCRQASSAVDSIWILGISQSIFEFVSDPNLEFLVFFSLWIL